MNIFETNQEKWYTDMDLVKVIYIETPKQLWKAAAHNVLQHLKKLEKEQKVQSVSKQNDTDERIEWKYNNK